MTTERHVANVANIEYGAAETRYLIQAASIFTTAFGMWLLTPSLGMPERIALVGVAIAAALLGIASARSAFEASHRGDHRAAVLPGLVAICVVFTCYALSSNGTQQIFAISDNVAAAERGQGDLESERRTAAAERIETLKARMPALEESQAAAVAAFEEAKAKVSATDAARLAPDACDNGKYLPNDADHPRCNERTEEWLRAQNALAAAQDLLDRANGYLNRAIDEIADAEKARVDTLTAASGGVVASAAAIVASASEFTRFVVQWLLNAVIDFGSVLAYPLTARGRRETARPVTMEDLKSALEQRPPASASPWAEEIDGKRWFPTETGELTGDQMRRLDQDARDRERRAFQAVQFRRAARGAFDLARREEAESDDAARKDLRDSATASSAAPKAGGRVVRLPKREAGDA